MNHFGRIAQAIRAFGIFIILLFVSQSVPAQQYRFDSFTTDNGLPQNGVRGIAQTPDGYLWLTTFDGLVRFDGVRFTVFDKNNSPGIKSNRFMLLHVEPDGTLFAGTEDGGLTVYDGDGFKNYTTGNGMPSNNVTHFRTDTNGEFYIQTSAGNHYFRNGAFSAVPASATPNGDLFYTAPSGSLWLYGADGVRQIMPDKREITYPLRLDYFNDRYTGIKLFEDSRGNLWLGDASAVYALKDGNVTRFAAESGVPSGVILRPYVEAADGSVWFSSGYYGYTEKVGLVRFHEGRFTAWGEEAGLSNPSVYHVFKDREGTIWTATDRGLNRLRKQPVQTFSTADGLVNKEVYPLMQTRGGDIYAGTPQGLSRFRGNRFEDVVVRKDNGNFASITALYEDAVGQIWVGETDGLYRLENDRLRRIDSVGEAAVWTIGGDRAGGLWIGTGRGLFYLKDEKLVRHLTVKDGLPSDDVKIVHEDARGVMWFGTYGGLVQFSGSWSGASGDSLKTYTTAEGLASDRVRAIYEDAAGTLWIGTYDGGLSRLRNGKFFNYTIENGLFNNGAFHIIEDAAGNFWISSNRGIYRVKKAELEDLAAGRISMINSVAYGKTDGMLSTECNGGRQPAGIKARDGRFWFPTQDGAVVVNPNEVSFNPNPPPVKIETVLVERGEVDAGNGIALDANEDNLEIRFTGISFIKPEQIKFRYRIEGLSDKWTDVGTIREVYFPSLPAGEYVFRVIAANSDGVWNTEGAKLSITVRAPFWQNNWFIAAASAMIIFIAFALFRLRVRELERRQAVQQEFSRKLIESQERERKRIASELHDSLGQYLLAIKNWALFGLNSIEEKNPAREYLSEVSETTALALSEVREMTHNLRPYQLERLGLTNTLEYMLKNLQNSAPVKFSGEIENIDGVLSKDAEIIFYRIVQESVTNVLKHSGAKNAGIEIRAGESGIRFTCRDDGRGFDVEAAKNSKTSGLGLKGIAERVKILKGEFEIGSEVGKGTTLFIKVPGRNE